MAKKNSIYKKKEDGSFEFWGYLPKEDVVSALDGTAKYANVLKNAPGQYGVDGMNRLSSWNEINAPSWHGIRAQLITSSLQGKTEPDGTIMTFGWDTSYYDTQLIIPGGDSTGKVYNPMLRTQSGSQTYGTWHYIPYMEDVLSSSGGTIDAKEKRCPVEIKGGTAGERQNIRLYPSSSGGFWTAIAFLDSSAGDRGLTEKSWLIGTKEGYFGISKNGDGLFEEGSSYLRNNNDMWEFKGNKVLFHCDAQNDGIFRQRGDYDVIDTSTIGQQVVKSFTATEIDHGDKFDGDLSSTTLVSSPLHMAVSEFSTSEANSPTAPRTLTGNIEVTFGSAKKTIANMKYNPFMAYFFDHGYHFSAVKEGGDSTLYDKGIVPYGQFIYYCVYAYHSDGSDFFDAAIIMTDDTTEMSKYVMCESGKAKDLMIEGNYIRTDALKKVTIQEKEGTLALLTDIPSVPSVVDNLDSSSSSSTLSAYQGKVLNNKIGAITFKQMATNTSIGSIGASNRKSDEDLSYSAGLYGGLYGRFYVFSCLENGYNSDYGKLAVKTASTGKADMATNMVAGVSGETGWWAPQWLSLSVFVPANKYYYLWGCRVTNVFYSCIELAK